MSYYSSVLYPAIEPATHYTASILVWYYAVYFATNFNSLFMDIFVNNPKSKTHTINFLSLTVINISRSFGLYNANTHN